MVFCTISISCKKESASIPIEKNLTFVKTTLGGCHYEEFKNRTRYKEDNTDTVEITVINKDTLNVFVGMNYICCAPFNSETNIVKDTLTITLIDTCPDPNDCYCRCNCYYTWDFQLIEFEEKEYYFVIKLNDPREDNPIIFEQGLIDLSE